MIVLANDSHFAFRILAPVIRDHADRIEAVVISAKTRGRLASSFRIIRKCSRRYAVYRVLVDIITRLNTLRGRGSVVSLAKRAGIPILLASDVNRDEKLQEMLPADLGLAVNFDQIFREDFLAQFEGGVLNFHASRLPRDKGISPALWTFARGDTEIWATVYQVDAGLDSGPVFDQFCVRVMKKDTAFSLYERVCDEGGERLYKTIDAYYRGVLADPTPQHVNDPQMAFSWPDRRFDKMIRASKRRLISFGDIFRTLTSP